MEEKIIHMNNKMHGPYKPIAGNSGRLKFKITEDNSPKPCNISPPESINLDPSTSENQNINNQS